MPINWRSQIDIDEENRLGSSNADRPICNRCRNRITDDNWRRDMLGYVCSVCDARERQELRHEDLRHDADLENGHA